MEKNVYPSHFHIGCMKTGTKTLQHILAQDNRINLILFTRFFNTNRWYSDNYQHCVAGQLNIESDENIIRRYNGMAGLRIAMNRIKSVRPDARIILTVREQRSLIQSAYKHHVRQTNDGYSFQEYLSSDSGICCLEMVDYAWAYDMICNFFDESKVFVFFYEDLRNDLTALVKSFYEKALEIEPPESIPDETVLNVGASTDLLYTKRRFNTWRFFRDKTLSSKMENKFWQVITLLTYKLRKAPNDAFTWQDNRFFKRLEEEFRDSNLRFQQQVGRDLAPLGYLV
jgi:hypothetical protein